MASKLYVGGLSYSTTSEALGRHFAQCGSVQSATVITDRLTGQSRGFGFVEMSTEAEARAAIARLDGQSVDGRRIKVNIASPSPARSGGGREGGFRSAAAGRGDRRPVRW